MKIFKTQQGIFLQNEKNLYQVHQEWDTLINRQELYDYLSELILSLSPTDPELLNKLKDTEWQAPVGNQELWAAGVTYLRSRDARMEESKASGGADFYDLVYAAERPELFFKALPQRIAANLSEVYIRKDSVWNVPEPELTLFINSSGDVEGYTIGNDMSSRSIEGENPLYLPQAKVYERSAALGPCLYVPESPISLDTEIRIRISRKGVVQYADSIQLNRMKRKLTELAHFLYRECEFPFGCYLMTGTGMVPPPDFTLQEGDQVDIHIEGIGDLTNTIGIKP